MANITNNRLLKSFLLLAVVSCALLWMLYRFLEMRKPASFEILAVSQWPDLEDDGKAETMLTALEASRRYLRKKRTAEIAFCGRRYSNEDYLNALDRFEALVRTSADLGPASEQLREIFDLCSLDPLHRDTFLITGYFQPMLKGSLAPSKKFRYPLYGLPDDLQQVAAGKDGKKEIGRWAGEDFVPYYTRAEIEAGDLLAGKELLYLQDPVDLFILHVQGSGLVELPDGSVREVLFAGSNGRPYRSIGRLLVDEGKIPLEEVSMPRIRQYLHQHLDEQQRILHYNERYIFFRLGAVNPGQGPVGSAGEPLTAGRSVAVDPEIYRLGGMGFLLSQKPVIDTNEQIMRWETMGRYVFAQDTGSAIKGPQRLDFFWGAGREAEIAAGDMKQPGRFYYLIPKPIPSAAGLQ